MLNHSRSSQSHTRNTIIARALVTTALLVSWPAIAAAQDGLIVAWGDNFYGQLDVPAPNTDFVAVAGGNNHSLGLKSDASIVAWGDNFYGQLDVPAPNTDFVAVAAGGLHSLGLKTDGSIVAWGRNVEGQLDVPGPNTDFVAVAGGAVHSLGLKTDGSIVAWGSNLSGQLNVPAPNSGFVAVAGGGDHSLGLKSAGSIVAWGWNGFGQLDVPAPNTDFVAAAGSAVHSLGLKADGSIVAWGSNLSGQLNVPAPNTDFVAVAGGNNHSLGLKGTPPPPTGACCIGNGCVTTNEAECTAAGGIYQGHDTTCAKADCPAPCPADFDDSGDVGVKDLLLLLGAWGPCPGPLQLVYSHEFVNGVTYCPGDPQYDDWLSYRASLPTSGVMSITVSGTQDPTGRPCNDPIVAQQIADAMRNQTTLTVDCGGFTWRVGIACQEGCGLPDNDLVLSVGGETCSCVATYLLRPGVGNENWGGITGSSCFSPTQTMTVTID